MAQEKLDIIVETVNGLHLNMASVPDQSTGSLVAEALYYYLQTTPPSKTQARYVWLRSGTLYRDDIDLHSPHLLQAWPEEWKDPEGHAASVAAWKSSPRGVSGDESEPNEKTTRQAIQVELDKLPERYLPRELTCKEQRYTLYVDHARVCWQMPAREAIHQVRCYVAEHEEAGWRLPTGVVNGNYD